MGLDMYLVEKIYSVDDHADEGHVERYEVLAYWRKHPDLHGYIVQEFAGGIDECQEIPLTKENIQQIIKAVKEDKLPYTTGFFFGVSDSADEQETIEKLNTALKKVEAGATVYYQASW